MSVMPDTDDLLRTLVWAGICTAGMAVLVTGIALALGTTGHDWYAAWKFTVAKMMLSIGFSDHGLIEYRLAAGVTINIERFRFVHGMDEAWSARRLIFSLVVDRAVLGACTGLALFAMWLAAETVVRLREFESGRGAVVEPPPRARREYAGRMRRPDDWSDGELIAALARRSGGAGVLLVSPDEVERLAGGGANAAGQPAAPRNALPAARPPAQAPGLPPPESARSADAAVPGEPAPADPGSRPDTTEADNPAEERPAGDKADAREREPGEQFF